MPNTSSAKKKQRVDIRRTEINSIRKGRLKKALKIFSDAEKESKEKAKENLPNLIKQIDLSAKNKILSKNKANRIKSKLTKKVN
ncbi:MAG: hypothetical protein Fur0024_1340 [Patescibacteria group bacterium]